jgi:hypothetical protein
VISATLWKKPLHCREWICGGLNGKRIALIKKETWTIEEMECSRQIREESWTVNPSCGFRAGVSSEGAGVEDKS